MSDSRHYIRRAPKHDHRRAIADRLAREDLSEGLVEARWAPDGALGHGAHMLSIWDTRERNGRWRRRRGRERSIALGIRCVRRSCKELLALIRKWSLRYSGFSMQSFFDSWKWAHATLTIGRSGETIEIFACSSCEYVVFGLQPRTCPRCGA